MCIIAAQTGRMKNPRIYSRHASFYSFRTLDGLSLRYVERLRVKFGEDKLIYETWPVFCCSNSQEGMCSTIYAYQYDTMEQEEEKRGQKANMRILCTVVISFYESFREVVNFYFGT
jgi:hypothetical protein